MKKSAESDRISSYFRIGTVKRSAHVTSPHSHTMCITLSLTWDMRLFSDSTCSLTSRKIASLRPILPARSSISLSCPECAEIDSRVARFPAREEAFDRWVHDDLAQLVVAEEACAPDR